MQLVVNSYLAPILCGYANTTSKIQIVRITNVPNFFFERTVFPGQKIVFEALPSAQLEVHTGMMASAILSDIVACADLQLAEVMEALAA